jgi:hypothetical protein
MHPDMGFKVPFLLDSSHKLFVMLMDEDHMQVVGGSGYFG